MNGGATLALLYSLVVGQLIGAFTGLLTFIKDLLTVSIELDSSVEYFNHVEQFIMKLPLLSSKRISITRKNKYNGMGRRINSIESNDLSEGTHLYWYQWRIIAVTKSEKNSYGGHIKTLKLEIPLGSSKFLVNLVEEIKNTHKKDTNFKVYNMTQYGINEFVVEKRNLSTIIIDEKIKTEIIEDYNRFRNNEKWYKQKGILYHRGYLFVGLPGTGKTSLALALASYFDCWIYIFSLEQFNHENANKIYSMRPGSIALIEDIDRAVSKKEGKKSKEIYRNMLQILDGVMSPNGILFILTTNNPLDVDPVILRSGRINREYKFGYATYEQAKEMFLQFFPGETAVAEEFAKSVPENKVVTAQIQEHLLRFCDDIVQAKKFILEENIHAALVAEENIHESAKEQKSMDEINKELGKSFNEMRDVVIGGGTLDYPGLNSYLFTKDDL